jgi:hypothetical protein
MLSKAFAEHFAKEWIETWNSKCGGWDPPYAATH